MKRSASAEWMGGLEDGKGLITTESGVLAESPYGFKTRFGSEAGTNPEELIAAAHVSCFTMALSGQLAAAKMNAQSIVVKATVSLDKRETDWTVTCIHLEVKIPGADTAKFLSAANRAKFNCPISRLLGAAAKITMDARLS